MLALCVTVPQIGCKRKNNDSVGECLFWTAPLTVKYTLEQTPDLKYGSDPSIEMCKNEVESVQLIVTPSENVTAYDLSVGALTNGKAVIPASNVSVYSEFYANITSTSTLLFSTGYYPDAMIPLSYVKEKKENVIKKGQNQAFVLQVKTDADTPAGIYTAPVTVTLNGKEYKKTLTVRVRDYAISTATHTKTAMAVWDDQLVYGHYEVTEELIDNYYEFFNDYRVTPLNLPNVKKLSPEEQADKVFEYALREDVSGINLPYATVYKAVQSGDYKGRSYATFDSSRMDKMLRRIIERCKQSGKNVFDKLYVYIGALDEPTASKYYMVREANNDFMVLKNALANDARLFGGSSFSGIKESMLDMDFIITTPINDSLYMDRENGDYRGVDTWCPQFDNFSTEEDRALVKERQAAGDKVWWYGCMMPTNPYPTYHIDDNLVGSRILNYMMMDYGIDGNLYWSVNIYAAYDKALRSYVYRDQWTNPMAYPGINGDGYLVYPGTKYGVNGPIPTIRLESIRDGIEDYEALYLLKNLTENLAKQYGVEYDFNDSMRNLYDLLYDGAIPTADEQRLAFVRTRVSDLIEAANDGILVTYARNDKTNKVTASVYGGSDVTDVEINGAKAASVANATACEWRGEFLAKADQFVFAVSYVKNNVRKTFDKYISGYVSVANAFDKESDLSAVEVSDGDEYDEKNDTMVSISKSNAISGSSLKIDYSGIDNAGYRSTVKVNDVKFEADTAGVRFYVFNASDDSVVLDVKTAGSKTSSEFFHNVELAPHSGRYVSFRIDKKGIVEKFDSISFVFATLNPGESRTVFIDNLALVSESFFDAESILRNVEKSTESFGNYIPVDGEIKFDRAEGVIFDFEETASMFHNIQYRYVNPSLSIVHDKKYVTSLNGALRVVVNGQPESGSDYCPAIIFRFDDNNTDLRKVRQIVVDVTVEANRDVELGFNILFRAGNTTANRLELVESGKQQFVYNLEEPQRIMRSSGIAIDYLTEEEHYISGVEVWMNNLTAEDEPFVLIFDNLRFIY